MLRVLNLPAAHMQTGSSLFCVAVAVIDFEDLREELDAREVCNAYGMKTASVETISDCQAEM